MHDLKKSSNKADLSSNTVEWYTPSPIIEAARRVLTRGIELDAASSTIANNVVQAEHIFTEADDALSRSWKLGDHAPSTWVNPPSSNLRNKVLGTKSQASAFWRMNLQQYLLGNILDGLYLVVSTKLMSLNSSMLEFPYCLCDGNARSPFVTRQGRIKFVSMFGDIQNQPTQSNAIILLPNPEQREFQIQKFVDFFDGEFGTVYQCRRLKQG
jgi:hypothetical protein